MLVVLYELIGSEVSVIIQIIIVVTRSAARIPATFCFCGAAPVKLPSIFPHILTQLFSGSVRSHSTKASGRRPGLLQYSRQFAYFSVAYFSMISTTSPKYMVYILRRRSSARLSLPGCLRIYKASLIWVGWDTDRGRRAARESGCN